VANADTWHDHRLGTDPDIASDNRGADGFECIAGVGKRSPSGWCASQRSATLE
jgi:hypothetical protein